MIPDKMTFGIPSGYTPIEFATERNNNFFSADILCRLKILVDTL